MDGHIDYGLLMNETFVILEGMFQLNKELYQKFKIILTELQEHLSNKQNPKKSHHDLPKSNFIELIEMDAKFYQSV